MRRPYKGGFEFNCSRRFSQKMSFIVVLIRIARLDCGGSEWESIWKAESIIISCANCISFPFFIASRISLIVSVFGALPLGPFKMKRVSLQIRRNRRTLISSSCLVFSHRIKFTDLTHFLQNLFASWSIKNLLDLLDLLYFVLTTDNPFCNLVFLWIFDQISFLTPNFDHAIPKWVKIVIKNLKQTTSNDYFVSFHSMHTIKMMKNWKLEICLEDSTLIYFIGWILSIQQFFLTISIRFSIIFYLLDEFEFIDLWFSFS